MYPKGSHSTQNGSMLVIAIFVIVVMSLLGLAMSRILSASSNTIVYEVYGLRAMQAARAGIEAKIAEVFPLVPRISDCASDIDSNLDYPQFTDVPGFENCDFVATCTATEFGTGVNEGTLYRFSSTGSCEVGEISVSRTVSVEAWE